MKCLSKVFGHHESSAVLLVIDPLNYDKEEWTAFFQKTFPHLMFWWWRCRSEICVSSAGLISGDHEGHSQHFPTHQTIQWLLGPCGEASVSIVFLHSFIHHFPFIHCISLSGSVCGSFQKGQRRLESSSPKTLVLMQSLKKWKIKKHIFKYSSHWISHSDKLSEMKGGFSVKLILKIYHSNTIINGWQLRFCQISAIIYRFCILRGNIIDTVIEKK